MAPRHTCRPRCGHKYKHTHGPAGETRRLCIEGTPSLAWAVAWARVRTGFWAGFNCFGGTNKRKVALLACVSATHAYIHVCPKSRHADTGFLMAHSARVGVALF